MMFTAAAAAAIRGEDIVCDKNDQNIHTAARMCVIINKAPCNNTLRGTTLFTEHYYYYYFYYNARFE